MITEKDFEKEIERSVFNETAAERCFELSKQMAIDFVQFQGRYYADIHNPVKTDDELFEMWMQSDVTKS